MCDNEKKKKKTETMKRRSNKQISQKQKTNVIYGWHSEKVV